MPDNQQKAKSESPSQQLLVLMDKASGKVEDSKGSSLPVYIVLVGIIVILFAVMGLLIVHSRRKAARLAYKLRQKEEELVRKSEDAKLKQHASDREKAKRRAAQLEAEIEELKEKLKASKELAAKRAETLSQAADWDDLLVVDKRQ